MRARRHALRIIAALLIVGANIVLPALGQDNTGEPTTRLKEVERAIQEGRSRTEQLDREAARIADELSALQKSLVESARRAQEQEETVSELEARLGAYRAEERALLSSLDERRQAINTTLGALQRLGRTPPAALLVSPDDVTEAVRTSVLLSAIVPELGAQAEALKSELAALRQIRTEIARRRTGLDTAVRRLKNEEQALDRLIARKARLRSQTLSESEEERRQIAALTANAEDLRNLIDRLERGSDTRLQPLALRPPADTVPFSRSKGTLPLPARGRIATRFGERNRVGLQAQGITVETRPGAQVVAPYDGRIVFAGEFRRYGRLLIIAHGEGYHSLLAGFESIDGVVGQWLLAGEPVGRMSDQIGPEKPELYIELRQNGEPINLLPWLATTETKVSG